MGEVQDLAQRAVRRTLWVVRSAARPPRLMPFRQRPDQPDHIGWNTIAAKHSTQRELQTYSAPAEMARPPAGTFLADSALLDLDNPLQVVADDPYRGHNMQQQALRQVR